MHLATQKLITPGDTKLVLREVLSICVEAVGAMGGTIYIHDASTKTLRFLHVLPEEVERKLERLDVPDDYGVAGKVFQEGAIEISHYGTEGDPLRRAIVRRTGVTVNTMITLPLQIKGMTPIGVVQLVNKRDGEFDENDATVLETISDVATLTILNSRLLEQQTRVASLEGMGRAAHDLANKAGVLMTFLPDFERNLKGLRQSLEESGVRGEACLYLDLLHSTFADVFAPYSERVFRYARLINDLAAGKALTPKKKVQNFAVVVEDAVQYLEPTARANYVRIVYDLKRDAPEFAFDDLYVIRIVENVVGNGIKAVREMVTDEWLARHAGEEDPVFGSVTVRHRFVEGHHILDVTDDGAGMSPATIRQILTGAAKSNWEVNTGSGLGTKVIVELAAAHGAKLSVRSKLGQGSTFELDFPSEVPVEANDPAIRPEMARV